MSSVHFESTYDNSQLVNGIRQDNRTVGQWARNIQGNGAVVESTFRNVTRAAEAYLSLRFAAKIGNQIIQTRGEFQQLQIAFETMLGSKAKADKIMSESIALAQKTPFTLLDVTNNIKQLMAMGIGYKNVMDTLKSLGDVAAGVSVPLSRIAINYGQVATLGKLQQREIRDFAMAGVPIIDELAKNLGKAKDEIYDMVSAGKVGFKDVEYAFQSMTEEGGKFYNLMEKQNASVTGQISNLQDKIQVMLNSIGKANEGLIYGSIKGLSELVTHYNEVLDLIKVLVATYGTYKAVIILTAAAQKAMIAAENIAAWFELAKGIRTAKDAQIAFNLASKANPYALVVAGIGALISALIVFSDKTDKAIGVSVDFNKNLNDTTTEIKNNFKAITEAESGTKRQADAIQIVNDKYKEYLPNLLTEKSSLEDIKKAQDAVTSSMAKSLAFKAQGDQLKDLKTNVDDQLTEFYSQIDKSSKKLDNTQKGQFKALVEEYKKEVETNFKTLGYFPQGTDAKFLSLFDQISGKGLSGRNATGLDLAMKGLIRSEIELDTKTNGLKTTYEAYLKALGLTGTNTDDADKKLKTIQQQIDETTKLLVDAEKKMKDLRAPDSTTTIKDLKDQEDVIKSLKTKLETLTGIKKKEIDKQLKNEQDKIKSVQDLANKELEIRQKVEEAKVAAMKDGIEKQKKQAEISYRQELLDITKEEQDYLDSLNKSKGLKSTDKGYITTLPEDTQASFNQRKTLAEQKYNNEIIIINKEAADQIKKIWNQATDAFITDNEREKRAINQKYDDLIKEAKKLGNEDQVAKLNEQRNREIQNSDAKAAIKRIDLEEEVETNKLAIGHTGYRNEQKLLIQKLELLKKYAQERIKILSEIGGKENEAEIKKLKVAVDNADKGITDINEKLSKDTVSIFDNILSTVERITDKFKEQLGLSDEQAKALEDGFQAMSGIADIASGNVIQGTTKLLEASLDLFLKTPEKLSEHFENVQEQIDKILSSVNTASEALSHLNVDSSLQSIAILKNQLKDLAEEAKILNDELANSYYGPRRGDYSTVVTNIIKDAAELNEEIKKLSDRLLQGGLSDEQRKSIEALLESYNSLVSQIDSTVGNIIGSSVSDLKDSLADAFFSGEDAAKSWGDTVNQIISKIAKDQLVTKLLTTPIDNAVNTLLNNYGDGTLSTDEMKTFKDTMTAIYTDVAPAFEEALKGLEELGINYGADISSSQFTGAIKNITEDTASLMVGQLNAMRIDLKAIEESGINRMNILEAGLTHLSKIEENTSYLEKLVTIETAINETNRILIKNL